MGRRKTNRREYKLIGFKAYRDTDADIVAWWEHLPDGERSELMRDLIRGCLMRKTAEVLSARQTARKLDETLLTRVYDDTAWIRSALNDMPAYLERVIQHVAAMQPSPQPTARLPADQERPASTAATSEPALSDSDSQRRERRMKKASW